MLTRVSLLAFVAFIGIAAQPLSPVEEKLVGTWKFIGFPGHLGTLHFEFRVDRTYQCTQHGGQNPVVTARGTWKVDGNDLIIDEHPVPHDGRPADAPHINKQTIRASSSDRIAFANGPIIERMKGK